jgi:hypothetical protein
MIAGFVPFLSVDRQLEVVMTLMGQLRYEVNAGVAPFLSRFSAMCSHK